MFPAIYKLAKVVEMPVILLARIAVLISRTTQRGCNSISTRGVTQHRARMIHLIPEIQPN